MMIFLTDQFAYLIKLLNNNNKKKSMKKFHKYHFWNQKKNQNPNLRAKPTKTRLWVMPF